MIHVDIWKKTKFCKSNILLLKINNFFIKKKRIILPFALTLLQISPKYQVRFIQEEALDAVYITLAPDLDMN